MHEAFRVAAERWPREGVPNNPTSWLISTARFKGIDAIRRRAKLADITAQPAVEAHEVDESPEEAFDAMPDDLLRLVFTCCHPSLPARSRVALALRSVCGLSTPEVARCFMDTPEAMKRRLSRAKANLGQAGVAFEIPRRSELPERLGAVLQVIYLVYNEGYTATSGEVHIRRELTQEAVFLAQMVAELLPEPEAIALWALLLLHEARAPARTDEAGEIIALENQDRSQWNRASIEQAQRLLQQVFLSGRVGRYGLQAAIAVTHAVAPSVEQTNWGLIVDYYDMLLALGPSPVVELQRAVALAMRDGPEVGLAAVEALLEHPSLVAYHSAHAIHADLARRAGRLGLARDAYDRAIALAKQGPEARYLERRRHELGHPD